KHLSPVRWSTYSGQMWSRPFAFPPISDLSDLINPPQKNSTFVPPAPPPPSIASAKEGFFIYKY
ncbi:MAG TPA: hypothetical protein VMV47_01730, partial [Bacteroidales bacterium]|nr:hypothetical protein [Bacteroidales bacterium]